MNNVLRSFCLLFLLLPCIVYSQSNYSLTNFRFVQTTYSDISAAGTAIPMTDPAAGASVNPIDIGFSFNFNGTSFTQCMIHADGILRFGTEAPGTATQITASPANSHAPVFSSTAAGFQNVVMPLFTNLVVGSAPPEFHVLTAGSAPNRICTIQWKNLRDADNAGGGTQHQFANLEFQVKLYEGTNDIEFIYGTWLPSPQSIPSLRRFSTSGIKASSANFLATHRGNSLTAYHKTEVIDPPKFARSTSSPFNPLRKTNIPASGIGYRFFGQIANDVSAAKLYLDSIRPVGKQTPGQIEVLVRNEGTQAASDINVQLQINGANNYNTTINIASLPAGVEQNITFPEFDLPNKGQQTVFVTVTSPGDSRLANNSLSAVQVVSQSHTQVYDYTRTFGGIGYNGSSGLMALKIYGTGTRKISQIRVPFDSYRNAVNVRIYEDGGTNGSPSANPIFTSPSFFTTSEQELIIPVIPAVTVEGDYYIAVNQQTTDNMGWMIGINTPLRVTRRYSRTLSTWAPQINTTPWQVLAQVYEESSAPDIGIERLVAPGCTYSTNTEVKVSLRNFSSQAINFSATPATITGKVEAPDGSEVPFTIQKNSGTLAAGSAEEVTVLNSYDFSKRGFHTFLARTNLVDDAETGNDSLRFFINNSIPISFSPTAPVCPLSPVTLTGVGYLGNPLWELEGPAIGGAQPLVINPIKNTVVKFKGTDYRGCVLEDSVIVKVTNEQLPPKPVLLGFDTILSHRKGFVDTVRVQKLDGHTIQWLGGAGITVADSAYAINSIAGMDGARVAAAYIRTADGCANISDTITYRYIEGALQTTTAPLTVCDTAYYDSGGPAGNALGNSIRTFVPSAPGTKMKLTIYSLGLAPNAALFIYDGPNASSPRIEALEPSMNGNTRREFIASNAEGVLSLEFRIGSNASAGWWGGLTCYVPEEYRTITDGPWTDPLIWESRVPGGAFAPAKRPPVKGDANIFIRHAVVLEESLAIDQVIVEPGGQFNIQQFLPQTIGLDLYKTEPNQPEILVRGRLLAEGNVSLFGRNGVIEVQNGDFANGVIVNLDSVLFTGTEKVRFGLPGKTGRINYMRMDNPAGMDVIGHQEMWGIAFRRGLINTQANAMIILREEEWFINFASNQSHINGPARVALTRNAGERFFPIGENGIYRPIFVNNSSNLGGSPDVIDAEVIAGPPPNRTLPPTIDAVSQISYYRVSRTGSGGANFRVIIPYGNDDGVTDHTGLSIAKDNGSGAWIDLGGTATTPAPGRITSNVFNEFSDFVLANKTGSSNPLPVTWLSFIATKVNADARLTWRTTQESNCSRYDVERSADGILFERIGTVTCNNTTGNSTYTYLDVNPGSGTFYYRIRQVDIDGKFEYSAVQTVPFAASNQLMVYPNPASNVLNIGRLRSGSYVQLYDAAGRLIQQTRSNGTLVTFNTQMLPSGLYELVITDANGARTTKKVQIVK